METVQNVFRHCFFPDVVKIQYFCFIFETLDFGVSLDMKGRPLAKNIADAKGDFRIFLYSIFKLIEPKSNWHWLGFGDEDEFRMKDKFIFAKTLAEDAVSLIA